VDAAADDDDAQAPLGGGGVEASHGAASRAPGPMLKPLWRLAGSTTRRTAIPRRIRWLVTGGIATEQRDRHKVW
jgi:hypothetical protein